jgi:hypothetical protein
MRMHVTVALIRRFSEPYSVHLQKHHHMSLETEQAVRMYMDKSVSKHTALPSTCVK